MIYQDRIYGKTEIKEPVLLELMESNPLQRLKGIAQYGIPDEFYHLLGYSRFEHSLGVMLLLKKFGASLEEQAAGLLHDISHTAFSHVFDWIFGGNETEDRQDKIHKNFILKSEIADILKKYGLDCSRISQTENYKLLEREIPNLCADRIDYAFRDALWDDNKPASCYLNNLTNFDGNIVFTDPEAGESFARDYLKCQTDHWGEFEAVGRYYLFSLVLRKFIEKKVLSLEDFCKDDDFVIGKIYKSRENNLIEDLEKLKNKKLEIPQGGGKKIIKKKFRYVDPGILKEGRVVALSSLSPEFKNFLENQKAINSRGVEI